jgi:hypothetical protein
VVGNNLSSLVKLKKKKLNQWFLSKMMIRWEGMILVPVDRGRNIRNVVEDSSES